MFEICLILCPGGLCMLLNCFVVVMIAFGVWCFEFLGLAASGCRF